jgi:Bacterial aa3 type cytochrome c oxidase subunit IV.
MAKNMSASEHAEFERGKQQIEEQISTYRLFLDLAKWGSLVLGAFVLFLTLWFMPNGNFFTGAFAMIVMLAAGIWFLRTPKSAR